MTKERASALYEQTQSTGNYDRGPSIGEYEHQDPFGNEDGHQVRLLFCCLHPEN